jgi:hypothetical protein
MTHILRHHVLDDARDARAEPIEGQNARPDRATDAHALVPDSLVHSRFCQVVPQKAKPHRAVPELA